jgi:DNA processing protein
MRSFRRGWAGYPDRLLALRDAPEVVYVEGELPRLSPSVAIVGARRASEHGRSLAERMASELSRAGVTVVSGGALGIDIAAHRGALRGRRPTLVVLPGDVRVPYPRAHAVEFEAIVEAGGALLSETTQPPVHRGLFAARNRLIAALADAVVVVEAAARSGTRHTIAAASRLGKLVLAIPWGVGDPQGIGCVDALRAGGRAVCSADDVLACLGVEAPADPRRSASNASPIAALLERGGRTVDEIARAVGREVEEVMIELTKLEIEGVIAMRGGGRFELRADR